MLRAVEVLHWSAKQGRRTVTHAIFMQSRQTVTRQTRVDEERGTGRDMIG
jgi:hypothetical protein